MGIHPRLPGLTADREPAEALPVALATGDGTSRRSFLTKVAVGGAALTLGSQLVPAARLLPTSGAQEGEAEVTLDEDEARLAFLASIALATSETYRAAATRTTDPLPEPMVEVVEAFGRHHAQQAATLKTLLPEGYDAEGLEANVSLTAEQATALDGAGSPEDVLDVLRTLEESVAATQFAAIGALTSQAHASQVATFLPVCAQHATVLGTLAGQGPADVLPEVQDDEGALSPSDHPISTGGDGSGPESGDSTTTTANQGGEGVEPGDGGDTGQTGEGTESGGGGATDDSDGGGSSAGAEG